MNLQNMISVLLYSLCFNSCINDPSNLVAPPEVHESAFATVLDSLRYALNLPALAAAIVEVNWGDSFEVAKGGKSEFVWDNLVLLGEIEFRRRLSARFDFQGIYSFGYFSADRPLPMKMSINNLSAGILWLF